MSRYQVLVPGDAPTWARRMQAQLNDVFGRITNDMRPRRITKAELPGDESERVAIVTDDVGGEVMAFRDTAGIWRRCTDRAPVA